MRSQLAESMDLPIENEQTISINRCLSTSLEEDANQSNSNQDYRYLSHAQRAMLEKSFMSSNGNGTLGQLDETDDEEEDHYYDDDDDEVCNQSDQMVVDHLETAGYIGSRPLDEKDDDFGDEGSDDVDDITFEKRLTIGANENILHD